jgi:hypothetical protein
MFIPKYIRLIFHKLVMLLRTLLLIGGFVEVLALVVLAADLLLLVDVRQEVAYVLELRAFGSHAGSRWLGAETLVPCVADVQRS